MVSVKIEVPSSKGKDVRRIRLEDLPNEAKSKDDFDVLVKFLQTSFPLIPQFTLKYQDDEGDMVTIASNGELQEALRVANSEKRCLRMQLVPTVAPNKEKSPEIQSEKSKPSQPPQLVKDPLHVEVQFNGKTERLIVSKPEITLAQLRGKVIQLCPELGDREFNLKYLDDEGDAVTMTEQEELVDAVQLVQEGQVLVIVVVVNPLSSLGLTTQTEGEKPATQSQKEAQPQKEEEGKKKKQWEDITWDDLNETLEKLQKLGFTDTALCTRLLEKYNYDFDDVLAELRRSNEKVDLHEDD